MKTPSLVAENLSFINIKFIEEAFDSQQRRALRYDLIPKVSKISKSDIRVKATECFASFINQFNKVQTRSELEALRKALYMALATVNIDAYISMFHTAMSLTPKRSKADIRALRSGDILDVAFISEPELKQYIVVEGTTSGDAGMVRVVRVDLWNSLTRRGEVECLVSSNFTVVGRVVVSLDEKF